MGKLNDDTVEKWLVRVAWIVTPVVAVLAFQAGQDAKASCRAFSLTFNLSALLLILATMAVRRIGSRHQTIYPHPLRVRHTFPSPTIRDPSEEPPSEAEREREELRSLIDRVPQAVRGPLEDKIRDLRKDVERSEERRQKRERADRRRDRTVAVLFTIGLASAAWCPEIVRTIVESL